MDCSPTRPPSRTSVLHVVLLFVLTIGFYLLLLASAASCVGLLFVLLYWTQLLAPSTANIHGLELVVVGYAAGALFVVQVGRCLFVRIGEDPLGIKADPQRHALLFTLVQDVAERVHARPINDVFITPEAHIGVWEERAVFMPPGVGRRKVVIGMGALSSLTLDQIRSILAHEYGHFSHRDLTCARIMFRVNTSANELVAILETSSIYRINPFYWALRGYIAVFNRAAASFARRRELCADRFAADAYGRDELATALIAAHIEGAFFREVGIRGVIELARNQKGVCNLYHFVGVSRRIYETRNPDCLNHALVKVLADKACVYDRHPSLNERLVALGVSTAAQNIPPLPALPRLPELDLEVQPDILQVAHTGRISAAEELFGSEMGQLQSHLSDLLANRYADVLSQIGRRY